ncbi:MAG: Rrf2 family transcriptional regulator [Acidiferrobacterales bacterium]|jgi:Rrf2 family iron-sulfur cluster assembly transcriptional regulator|nr:Rrf2 family transcriptional regulator [Acidiferrobacterales bacterium]
MKLSTKSRYAVSSLMELAISGPNKPITLSDLAAKQGISLSYAEQLFAGLREHKLVKGTRGPGGGFILAREPSSISIAEIIEAVYDRGSNRSTNEETRSSSLWNRLDEQVDQFLENIDLATAISGDSNDSETLKLTAA